VKTSTLPRQRLQEVSRLMMSREEILERVKQLGCLIIGVGMLKGGTGKTTSTIYLALYLAKMLGLRVCVIDTDDNSQTVDNWYKVRERKNPPEDVPFDLVTYDPKNEEGPDFDDVLEELSGSYDVILVDVGGAGKETYWELSKTAHMLLLPMAPSGFETTRMPATLKQASRGGKQNPNRFKVFMVLVKCDNRTTLPDEQQAALEGALEALEATQQLRVPVDLVHEDFNISGATHYPRSWDHTPKTPDLEEYGVLFRYMMKQWAAAEVAA
jgi:chromosome partitioning protein